MNKSSRSLNSRKTESPLTASPQRAGALYRFLYRLWRETRGQNLTEYALLVAMVALSLVSASQKLGCTVGCMLEEASISIDKARGHIPPGQQKKCSKTC